MRRADLFRAARTGAITLFLACAPLALSAFAQTNANNTNTAVVRPDDGGSDWGWLNWLGLLGLLGLIPRKPEVVRVRRDDSIHVRK
jgi:MYXO-CTERM domain-containing protein